MVSGCLMRMFGAFAATAGDSPAAVAGGGMVVVPLLQQEAAVAVDEDDGRALAWKSHGDPAYLTPRLPLLRGEGEPEQSQSERGTWRIAC